MAQTKHKNFITPVMRTSFTNVFEAKEALNGEMVYSTALLIPADDEEGIRDIKSAIASAAREKWGDDKAKWPKPFDMPLRNGNDKTDLAAYQEHMYLNAKSKFQPQVVNSSLKPIMSEDDFYSGCFCRAQLNFYAYSKAGKHGVGIGLINLMKVKDGARLDGRQDAAKAFEAFKVDESEGESDAGEDEEFFDDE